MSDWKFADPPNLAVIVDAAVLNGKQWIAYVSHDADDGGWQFHGPSSDDDTEPTASLISLKNVLEIDPTIVELNGLELGYCAFRASKDAAWQVTEVGLKDVLPGI